MGAGRGVRKTSCAQVSAPHSPPAGLVPPEQGVESGGFVCWKLWLWPLLEIDCPCPSLSRTLACCSL